MDGARALSDQLGAPAPRGLVDALEPAALERLAVTVREARVAQARALEASTEEALGFVPRLLRGPVKRIVGIG